MVAERPIDADAALALLAPDEKARVRDFVLGAPADRELLSGSAPVHTFLDCFVCWSGDSNRALLAEGRSLRQTASHLEHVIKSSPGPASAGRGERKRLKLSTRKAAA